MGEIDEIREAKRIVNQMYMRGRLSDAEFDRAKAELNAMEHAAAGPAHAGWCAGPEAHTDGTGR